QDKTEAVKHYRLAAAYKEESHGQVNLGRCYQYGLGVAVNVDKAVKCYRAAAEQNTPYYQSFGQNFLGWCYEHGVGLPADAKAAVVYYQKAAEQGLALAQTNLSRCYQQGIGVAVNETAASHWARQAVQEKDAYKYNADFFALCYENGWGVEKDTL